MLSLLDLDAYSNAKPDLVDPNSDGRFHGLGVLHASSWSPPAIGYIVVTTGITLHFQ